ncbi:MAG: IS3 family transposase [Tissierella sp.]|nr:IS3 family transposase [Tissierella sp.]
MSEGQLSIRKKAKSLSPRKRAKNKEKTKVIMELRQKFPSIKLKIWLKIANLSKSSFYEWVKKLETVNKEELELTNSIKNIFEESNETYGYRRITISLKQKGLKINHKRVYRIMKENGLKCIKFSRKSRGYSSFKGEVGKVAENKLNRRFQVTTPNKVWVTDVTEFKIQGDNQKLYLSPIMDLFNSEIISFNLSTAPTVKFTIDALDDALKKLPEKHELTIHSDQGFHYQHAQWVKRLEKNNIVQSMSRRGKCIDNSPMENFFGLLKQEMYYGEKFTSIKQLEKKIRGYINWYNSKRIKEKLNGLSPIEYRQQAA